MARPEPPISPLGVGTGVGILTSWSCGVCAPAGIAAAHETALEEAVFFAFNPGQAISYKVGKLQILRFLADAKLDQGEQFSLRDFHDYLLNNGNVPIALQRWEYLGDKSEVHRLEALGGRPATVPR